MDAQLRAVQSRGPSFGVRVRSRAHQTPFCARGHQKNIAVSENAPGAHGIVPRHCSTRAAGMNTVSAARPPPRNLRRETPAAAAPAAEQPLPQQPLPRREEQQGQTGEQHREVHSLVFDVIFLEEQRSEDESDHDAAAPYHRDDREQRPLILDRIEIECV